MTDELVAAVDVGGTAIKTALVDRAGRLLARHSFSSAELRGRPELIDIVVESCRATIEEGRKMGTVRAVGLVVPGIVDEIRRRGVSSMLLGWRDTPFGELVEAACLLPTALGHDVKSAARAEFATRPRETDALFVTLGTGVGAAALIGGSIRTGAHGLGGEIAHVVVADGPRCPCGKSGCVEVIAGAPALLADYAVAAGHSVAEVSDIVRLARSGDEIASRVWGRATDALSMAIATYCEILDPGTVILAGGVAGAGEALRSPVRDAVRRHISLPIQPEIVVSRLPSAGLAGAALIAWERLGR